MPPQLALPAGVTEASRSLRTLLVINEPIEARLYIDGLFSVSINVGPAPTGNGERLIRTAQCTIHTEQRGSREITVVGELPPATAKRIVAAVVFKAQP